MFDGAAVAVTRTNASNALASGKTAKGVATAKASVKKWSKPTTEFKAPGVKFDATPLKGQQKVVWYVPILFAVPIFHAISDSLKSALDKAGVQLQICDGNGNPADWDKCLSQAVQQGAAGIILDGFPPDLVAAGLQNAKQNGVPVILGNFQYPKPSTDKVAYTSLVVPKVAQLVADWIIADSNGKANVLIAETTDSSNNQELIHGTMIPRFKKLCPGCVTSVIGTTTADWSVRLGSETANALLADPGINYFAPEYDGMAPFMTSAAARAGRNDIKVSTFNANLQQMQDLAAGQFIFANVGANIDYLGWAYADQIMRMLLHVAPSQNANVPVRLFTRKNVKNLTITKKAANSGEWYGNVDYHAEFLKLWGLK